MHTCLHLLLLTTDPKEKQQTNALIFQHEGTARTVVTYTQQTMATFTISVPFKGDRGSTVVKVCATNWKVAGSIPDGVNGIFH